MLLFVVILCGGHNTVVFSTALTSADNWACFRVVIMSSSPLCGDIQACIKSEADNNIASKHLHILGNLKEILMF